MSGFTNCFSARRVSWVVGVLWILGGFATAAAQYGESFPGAEGFGSRSRGGRGGRVLVVDSLEDKVGNPPEGTLRWALEEQGRRIVVFRVAGTIELVGKIYIREPFITVAGQTAPGGGITLKGYTLMIEAHDVILQGIRVRLGAEKLANSDTMDINGSSAYNVMIDHCSFSWSTDEVVGVNSKARAITFQNSIFSEGLNCSTHPEGCHSRGPVIRDGSRDVTFLRNLFAHNDFRNPKMFGDPSALGGKKATFDFYNNVVYNWGRWAVLGAGNARVNVESNYFKTGPSTYGYPEALEIKSTHEEPDYRLWVDGNYGPSCPSGCTDDWEEMVQGTADEHRASARNRTPPAEIEEALTARALVMAEVGASYRLTGSGLRVSRRDAVDERLVEEFWDGTGGFVNDPAEAGGWPLLDAGVPVVDSDLDGMPDLWESDHGLDPNDANDASENADGDVYTNVEEYLFESDPNVVD